MTEKSQAKMFLADERGLNETTEYRSYQTFNFGSFVNAYKHPFNNVQVLNDDTLAAESSLTVNMQEDGFLLLLPVVGAVAYSDFTNDETIVNAGQLQLCHLNKDASFTLSNLYEKELVNFLQIQIKSNKAQTAHKQLFKYDVDESKNKLVTLTSDQDHFPIVTIGKFAGRAEAVYRLKNDESSLLVFIIEGVFEVQGRLLHPRDGLGLWNISGDIEMEALSNDAIVLMIEPGN